MTVSSEQNRQLHTQGLQTDCNRTKPIVCQKHSTYKDTLYCNTPGDYGKAITLID